MAAKTPDAYRIGAGQVTQDYPVDAAPARARKQPSLPTMARVPESVSSDEQVITAEVAVVRRQATATPRSSNASRPSKDAVTVAQQKAVVRDGAPAQAGDVAAPPTPAREYADRDEAVVAFEGDRHPGVPVHSDWHRTTMRVVGAPAQRNGGQHSAIVEASSSERAIVRSSHVGGAARLKLVAPVTSNRGWIGANAQRIVEVDTMAWSCSSLASSRLFSLSQRSLRVSTCRARPSLAAFREPSILVMQEASMLDLPAIRPRSPLRVQ